MTLLHHEVIGTGDTVLLLVEDPATFNRVLLDFLDGLR